jgi:UDP-N-acetylmuramate: L-alanyl-gamma-D-glutamyl-meso-diaminopimelate ligase
VPGAGKIIAKSGDKEVSKVLDMGCWSQLAYFGTDQADWQALPMKADFSAFEVRQAGLKAGEIHWSLIGRHNADNALAAIAAAAVAGVTPADACAAVAGFKGVRRRLQRLPGTGAIAVYDDFAHHPTAIRATLEALRRHVGDARIGVVLEPRSNTMKLGVHNQQLAPALEAADRVFMYRPGDLGWDPGSCLRSLGERAVVLDNIDDVVSAVVAWAQPDDNLVIMSNGGFGDMGRRLRDCLGR